MAMLKYMNPFRIIREFVRNPIETFFLHQYFGYRKRTEEGINSVKELLYRGGVISVFVTAILWLSIFMYVVFYYTYMPNVTHMRPVHLQFKSCDEQMGLCSFPSAHVQLTKYSQMMMSAQPYRVRLVLDMPESPINKELGMFMVCAQMRAKGGVLVSSSCRSAMLRHRSIVHQFIRTVVFAPLLLSGVNEERQQLHVELFSDFEDDQSLPVTDAYVELQSRHAQVYACELQIEAHFTGLRYCMYHWPRISAAVEPPVTDAYVELQSRHAQVYACELQIEAHFTGLRYCMYHWPRISAAVGIGTNLFFVSLIFILSWYHLQDGLPDFVKSKFGDIKTETSDEDDKTSIRKVKLERTDSSMFFDDESLIEELKQIEEPKKT